jgi:hypothetical protein
MTPCSLVDFNPRFEETCCIHLRGKTHTINDLPDYTESQPSHRLQNLKCHNFKMLLRGLHQWYNCDMHIIVRGHTSTCSDRVLEYFHSLHWHYLTRRMVLTNRLLLQRFVSAGYSSRIYGSARGFQYERAFHKIAVWRGLLLGRVIPKFISQKAALLWWSVSMEQPYQMFLSVISTWKIMKTN